MSQEKYYSRFSLSQRIEHWVLFLSFTILAVTGLPQKFVGNAWAEGMIAAMGGIETVRIIHRYSAIVLMVLTIYHGAAVTYKLVVQRVALTMNPGWEDIKDLFGILSYNLGLNRRRPALPRYNFEEKMEYWAVVWGTVIMAITGFMLWNPIATTNFLPGSVIPAAKAAHGAEAILAVLAIIIWHAYGVHLRQFNKSMFTGKLSMTEMIHEHAQELEQIETGEIPPPPPPEEQAKRARIFIPIAVIISMILLFGVYMFVAFEDTAQITTVAPAERTPEPVFDPISSEEAGHIHTTLTEYTGPESCAAAGCHSTRPLETAASSPHTQRIAAAGPNPWLAKLASQDITGGEIPPNYCLLCHAQDFQADDLLASAHTARVAGGETCQRCHSNYPENNIHAEVGLACISCHTSTEHQMETKVACQDCHSELPHTNPLLNSKHERLDCLTCHVRTAAQLVVDTSQPTVDPVTGFFRPTIESNSITPDYIWQTEEGETASIDSEGARIVPLTSVTLLAPPDLDPAAFALTGNTNGSAQETEIQVPPSHAITREDVRTCATCHGPEGNFDFASLGYDEEQTDNLSAKPAKE